jgi:hypothetical protein
MLCSVSCGGGVGIRHRTCDNPAPSHGGQTCHGPVDETSSCNIQPCPGFSYVFYKYMYISFCYCRCRMFNMLKVYGDQIWGSFCNITRGSRVKFLKLMVNILVLSIKRKKQLVFSQDTNMTGTQ